jgi:hypothetical protein
MLRCWPLVIVGLCLPTTPSSTGTWPVDPCCETTVETVQVKPVPRTELERLVAAAFPEDVATAFRIVECESRWDPSAVSPTNDHGLFQINAIHLQPGGAGYGMDPYNPVENITIARRLYDESGWRPWVCY